MAVSALEMNTTCLQLWSSCSIFPRPVNRFGNHMLIVLCSHHWLVSHSADGLQVSVASLPRRGCASGFFQGVEIVVKMNCEHFLTVHFMPDGPNSTLLADFSFV